MPKIIAFTFARAGSKGVLNKNIKLLNGKPLLSYTVEAVRECSKFNNYYISSDGEEIAKVANDLCVDVISRPEELASDTANEWLAWQRAIKYLMFTKEMSEDDIFVSVPCTSPFRNGEDLNKMIAAFLDSDSDLALGITEADHSPYFNMVKSDSNGVVSLLCDGSYVRRQDVPEAWNITTMAYVTTAKFVLNNTGVMSGKTLGVKMEKCRSLDIDTELDFTFAEFLMKNK